MHGIRTLLTAAAAATAVAASAGAVQKSTLFDLDQELAAFFELQAKLARTEPASGDTEEQAEQKRQSRAELFRQHGIRDEKHWQKESHAGFRYAWSERAEKRYGGSERVLELRRAAGEGKTVEQYQADEEQSERERQQVLAEFALLHDASALDRSLLEPIEGISLERYAAASNLAMYYDGDFARVTADTGISEEQYERIGELWQQRMRDDRTRLVMKYYGGHYMAAAQGRFAESGRQLGKAMLDDTPLADPEPITLEQWVEITEYYATHASEIQEPADVTRILEPYGLTFYEWNIASNWWGHRRTEAMNAGDQAFLSRWMALRQQHLGQ
jgi:hypothetical protein